MVKARGFRAPHGKGGIHGGERCVDGGAGRKPRLDEIHRAGGGGADLERIVHPDGEDAPDGRRLPRRIVELWLAAIAEERRHPVGDGTEKIGTVDAVNRPHKAFRLPASRPANGRTEKFLKRTDEIRLGLAGYVLSVVSLDRRLHLVARRPPRSAIRGRDQVGELVGRELRLGAECVVLSAPGGSREQLLLDETRKEILDGPSAALLDVLREEREVHLVGGVSARQEREEEERVALDGGKRDELGFFHAVNRLLSVKLD